MTALASKKPSRTGRVTLGILVALTLLGVATGVYRLLNGLGETTNLSNAYPWGLWIGFDFTLIAFSGGAFTLCGIIVILNQRRCRPIERLVILTGWLICFCYTITYCYLYGYLNHHPHAAATGPAIGSLFGNLESFDRDPASLQTPLGLGIPDWVFWGVCLPWLICLVGTCIYCTFFIADDPLDPIDPKSTSPTANADTAGSEGRHA